MKVKRLLKKLDYLPRWAWYLLSFFVVGPFGPLAVYLIFHVLQKAAKDEDESSKESGGWSVDIDREGVHVRSRSERASDAEIEQKWAQAERSARKAKPYSPAEKVQKESRSSISEDASVADVIREGSAAMQRIRQANDLIPDPALSAQIDSIENSCRQILSILEQRPQLLGELRTFLRYYLPTTLRLLDARAKLESTANTPKAREVRQRISEALGVIDKAFLKQVEALDEYRFIDLESEMDVLRDMLAADGLIEEQAAVQDDPFASVLEARTPSARRAQKRVENMNLSSGGH